MHTNRFNLSSSARGAAAIEGLIVILITSVFLACGLWLHRMCDAKLRAVRDARVATWTKAMQGCESSAEPSVVADSIAELAADDPTRGDAPYLSWLAPSDVAQSSSHTVKAPSFTRDRDVTSRCIVTCNESASHTENFDWIPKTTSQVASPEL